MHILVCNSGSSSLKFSLFEAKGEQLLAEGGIDWSTTPTRLVVRCTGQPEVREAYPGHRHARGCDHCTRDPAVVDPLIRQITGKEVPERLKGPFAYIELTNRLYSPCERHRRRCIQINTVAQDLG